MTNKEFLAGVSESCVALRKYSTPEEIYELGWALFCLLEEGGLPEEYLGESIGSGSYKEAYRFGNFCVKFAAEDSVTENEIAVYNEAATRGVQYIFCPTFFHKLPDHITIPLTEMDETKTFPGSPRYKTEYDKDGSHYAAPVAAYLIIQPMGELRLNQTQYHNPYDYDANPITLQDGSLLSAYEYLTLDAPYEWKQAVIHKYGDAAYRDISWALKRMKIEDLHSGNVAWLDETPIIIDWMSYDWSAGK